MTTILNKITDKIREDEALRFETFRAEDFPLVGRAAPINVMERIARGFFMIAEIKRASPSKGVIRADFDPVQLANDYEAGGASAVSVITERHFFQGDKHHLTQVKREVTVPVLRKDFIIHPFQVYEAYNLGADLILLIAACLSDDELLKLYRSVKRLGMEALVEVHDREELNRVLALGFPLVGINNRDLRTFEVDFERCLRLRRELPEHVPVIAESGIVDHSHILQLRQNGFAGALVGESLLRHPQPRVALEILLHG